MCGNEGNPVGGLDHLSHPPVPSLLTEGLALHQLLAMNHGVCAVRKPYCTT